MLETNKQALLFNFGEDPSYFVILRYKLRDFIKMYDYYANDPIKGDFQKTLLLFQIGRKSFVETAHYLSRVRGWKCLQKFSEKVLALSEEHDKKIPCSVFNSCKKSLCLVCYRNSFTSVVKYYCYLQHWIFKKKLTAKDIPH